MDQENTVDGLALRAVLEALPQNRPLADGLVENAFEAILSGRADPIQVAALLMGLKVRGETPSDIADAARVLRRHSQGLVPSFPVLDTCGTGGDGLDTYNISTAAAIVVAACGVPVAKHGNRSVSSKSGSSDVLMALGANLDISHDAHLESLDRFGFSFLFAPKHHAAMRHVAPVRAALKTRTVFNLLGPLANPAGAAFQLIGVYDPKWLEPMADVAIALGAERVWLVHGSDGLDEMSISGPTHVVKADKDGQERVIITPDDAGLDLYPITALKGGDAQTNAEAMRALFDGQPSAYRDSVLLNAAASLMVAGHGPTLRDCAAQAAAAIDDGRAARLLADWAAFTQQKRQS